MALDAEAAADSQATRQGRATRLGWYVIALTAVGMFIASIPSYIKFVPLGITYNQRFTFNPSPDVLTLNVLAGLFSIIGTLLSLYLAWVVFRHREEGRMTLFLSYYLLFFAALHPGPAQMLAASLPEDAGRLLKSVTVLITLPMSSYLFLLFPNGRFAPKWTRWLGLASFPLAVLLLWTFPGLATTLAQPSPSWLVTFGIAVLFAYLFLLLSTQIHRYRLVYSSREKTQTKWVLYGMVLGLTLWAISAIPNAWTNSIPSGAPFPFWRAVSSLIAEFGYFVLPISLAIAIMRHQLFDIDLLINRTVVYAVLSACVVGVYMLIVGGLGTLFQSSSNLLVSLVATGLVAVLFNPLRERLQSEVNRLLYGDRDEPYVVLRQLGQRLESSGMPEQTLTAIAETVAQALKLPYAEITLVQAGQFERIASHGQHTDETVSFPVQFQGATIGQLNMAMRRSGEALADSDRGLLRLIARQAAPIAHAVRLTRDLRQSRARLVTAREEERLRLRRDLHDGLGPVLASQGLKIAAVSHLVEADPERARQMLDELAAQNEAAVIEIRRLVYALRPPELDELGLIGAVRDYVGGLNVSTEDGTRYRVDARGADKELSELPAAVEVAVYRIATEALTNVTRHARASRCAVLIGMDGGHELRLEVSDDGVGLPEDCKAGIGLTSMRERAEDVGGTLTIDSAPQRGVRVIATFPLLR